MDFETFERLMRLSAIAMAFVTQPESIRPFTEWAKKHHAESNPTCDDPECAYREGNPDIWMKEFSKALYIMTAVSSN